MIEWLWDTQEEIRKEAIKKADRQIAAAAALADAAKNHIADPQDPHTLLDVVKALRQYREAGNE